MKLSRRASMILAATAWVTVCAASGHAAENAPQPGNYGCQVDVKGAVTASWTGTWADTDDQSQNVGAASDYWLSDDELKDVLVSLPGPEKPTQKLLMGLRRNPRFAILLINCMTDQGHVNFQPTLKTAYQDLPRKPGSFKVATARTGAPRQFAVQSLRVGKQRYQVTGGQLELKQFNFLGVAGTFTLKAIPSAEAKEKEITVKGSFNLPCTGAGSRCKSK